MKLNTITGPSESRPTGHRSILREAKKDPLTHQIITSQKWACLVVPESAYGPAMTENLMYRTAKRLKETLKIIQEKSPYSPLIEKALTSSLPMNRDNLMPNPKTIELHLKEILALYSYSATLKTRIDFLLSEDSLEYESEEEYIQTKNKQKEEFLQFLHDEKIIWNINQNLESINNLEKAFYKDAYSGQYFTRKANLKWQQTLLQYYKEEIQRNPKMLELPHGYTINPKWWNGRWQDYYLLTSQAQALSTLQSQITTPDAYKANIITLTPNKKVLFPQTTTELITKIEKKQQLTTYIYTKLTPEEQHTLDSITQQHIPEILNSLETLIQIESPNIPGATTQCNTILMKSLNQIEALLTKMDINILNNLTNETKSINNILDVTQNNV